MDRVEAELDGGEGEFLVGDELSVADVTAASLFGPIVAPQEAPIPPDQPVPAASNASATSSATAAASSGSKRPSATTAAGQPVVGRRPGVSGDPQPPIGNRGLAPQKTTVPSIPRMWTAMMLKTIDLAVAVPTPTGPPEAV